GISQTVPILPISRKQLKHSTTQFLSASNIMIHNNLMNISRLNLSTNLLQETLITSSGHSSNKHLHGTQHPIHESRMKQQSTAKSAELNLIQLVIVSERPRLTVKLSPLSLTRSKPLTKNTNKRHSHEIVEQNS